MPLTQHEGPGGRAVRRTTPSAADDNRAGSRPASALKEIFISCVGATRLDIVRFRGARPQLRIVGLGSGARSGGLFTL